MRWICLLPLAALALPVAAPGSTPIAEGSPEMCKQPRAPYFKLSKPRKPTCAMGGACEEQEWQRYKSEVRRYRKALHDYGEDLDRYYKRANKFLGCMSELD